jgi:hypothetical protein
MKKVISVLLVATLLTGCSLHYVKPDVTPAEHEADYSECKKTGLFVGGIVVTVVGVAVFWPLAFVGGAMIGEANAKEKACMHAKGYQQEAS